MEFVQFTEIMMLILFGSSWPFNIAKSIRSRSTKGKSVIFEFIVITGYSFGLCGKIVTYNLTGEMPLSFWFYIADIAMVLIDVCLYFRNRKYEKANGL